MSLLHNTQSLLIQRRTYKLYSLITCFWMAGPMMVAVAGHTCWEESSPGVFSGESRWASLTELARKALRTWTSFHPWSRRTGWTGGNGSWGQGDPGKLRCVWRAWRRKVAWVQASKHACTVSWECLSMGTEENIIFALVCVCLLSE